MHCPTHHIELESNECPGNGSPHTVQAPLQRAQVNFTAELLTAVNVDVPAGDDWQHEAYNAAINAVGNLLHTSLPGHTLSWSWDVQADTIQAVAASPPAALPQPGALLIHRLPDGGRLEMTQDGVYILDANGEEVACWVDTEWNDIDAVTATLNAISLALAHGAQAIPCRQQPTEREPGTTDDGNGSTPGAQA